MTEQKKNTMTRAQALEMAIEVINGTKVPHKDYLHGERDMAIDTLERMLTSITRPRVKKESETRIQNKKLAEKVVEQFAAGEWYSASDVAGFGIAGISSIPKATAVLAVAVSKGLVTAEKQGKRNAYKLAE